MPACRVGVRPEEPARPRGVRPLVQVGGVPVGAERRHVERDRPGRMRAVDEHGNAARVTDSDDRRDRQDERAHRRDVIDDDERRPVGEARCESRRPTCSGRGQRERHLQDADGRRRERCAANRAAIVIAP